MYDLKRIRYVTEHYRDLQGLTAMPFSLFLLGLAAYEAGWIKPSGWLANEWLLGLLSLSAMFALMWGIGKLYDRAFGWIQPDTRRESREGSVEAWVWGGLWGLAFGLAHSFSAMSLFGLWVVAWASQSWLHRKQAVHWLVLAVLIAGMTLTPLLDGALGTPYSSATAHEIAIKLVTAIGITIVGTLDHLTLVRTLGPLRREEESVA